MKVRECDCEGCESFTYESDCEECEKYSCVTVSQRVSADVSTMCACTYVRCSVLRVEKGVETHDAKGKIWAWYLCRRE